MKPSTAASRVMRCCATNRYPPVTVTRPRSQVIVPLGGIVRIAWNGVSSPTKNPSRRKSASAGASNAVETPASVESISRTIDGDTDRRVPSCA